MMEIRFWSTVVAAIMVGVLAAGCAGVRGAASSAGQTITVGQDRSGGNIDLHVGDRLVVQLGQAFAVPQGVRPVVNYPQQLLTLAGSAGLDLGTYTFIAKTGGSGQLYVMNPSCQPGPAVGAGQDVGGAPCPVLGPAGGPEPPSGVAKLPLRMFMITIHIS